jgi:hypothetical protein
MGLFLQDPQFPSEHPEAIFGENFSEKILLNPRLGSWSMDKFNSESYRSLIPSRFFCTVFREPMKKIILGTGPLGYVGKEGKGE